MNKPADADLAAAAELLGWTRGRLSYQALDGEAARDIERVALGLAAERERIAARFEEMASPVLHNDPFILASEWAAKIVRDGR